MVVASLARPDCSASTNTTIATLATVPTLAHCTNRLAHVASQTVPENCVSELSYGGEFGIACGQIDVGNAATDMTEPMTRGAPQAKGEGVAEQRIAVDDVARAVAYTAMLTPDANVLSMTVMATGMPYAGRG